MTNEYPKGQDWRGLREKFERDGCVVLRGFLSSDELKEVEQRLEAYLDQDNRRAAAAMKSKFQGTIKNLQKDDEFFADMMHNGRPAQLVKELLNEELDPATAAYFDRIPGEEEGIAPHFDALGHRTMGATLWIAIDEARIANGCLYYVKGSHKQVLESKVGLPNFDPTTEGAFPVELKPGDAAVHSSRTVHWSSPNQTKESRRSVSFFYWTLSSQVERHARWKEKALAKTG